MANLLSRFFGRTASEGAAFALGLATGPVLYPAVREIEQEANKVYPTAAIDPGDAAEIVAEDVDQLSWGEGEAALHGLTGDRFDLLVNAVLNAPGMGELFQARRRGLIDDATFRHGLRKARLETLWDSALEGLLDQLLSVADLANAVVQGHMDQNTATATAAKWGYSADDFNVLVENTGLPPGPALLLEWRRRGFITDDQLDQGIREGHTKTKYIPFFHDALAAQLSTAQITGLRVKGWITPEESYQLGAGHGFTSTQMDQMWEEAGRPATAHQIHIGYARGATVDGAADEEDAIRQSVQRSDVQTRYSDVIAAGRYTYPPFFAVRTLAQAGVLDEKQTEQILLFEGWEPTLAHQVAVFFAKPADATATVDPRVKTEQARFMTAAHKAAVKTGVSPDALEPYVAKVVTDADVRSAIFALWADEKAVDELPAATP